MIGLSRLGVIGASLLLAGCGQKGALYLPDQKPQSVSSSSVPTAPAAASDETTRRKAPPPPAPATSQ